MGSPQVSNRITPEQIALEATVMALREELMSYFKGSCIDRVAETDAIQKVKLRNHAPRSRYSYQRRRAEEEDATMILLGDAPILTMKKRPYKVVWHSSVLDRSKQFQHIRAELDKFMHQYLRGVTKEEQDGPVLYG